MPFHVDDSIGREMWLVQKFGAAALAEDADFFAEVAMQIQSRCRRNECENLPLLVE